MRIVIFCLLIVNIAANCVVAQVAGHAAPHVIVYKTRHDYRRLVPVTMNAERTAITSYPDPVDVRIGSGGYPLPARLHNGFLLDKRGVGENTVFLDISYVTYANLKTPPSPAKMLKMIKDKHPFTALYDCGNRYTLKDVAKELNALIDGKKMGKGCMLMNK
jgi:hypothetical protein